MDAAEGLRRTVCGSCMLPREPTDEMDNVFEREKALKRNVATRQPSTRCWQEPMNAKLAK